MAKTELLFLFNLGSIIIFLPHRNIVNLKFYKKIKAVGNILGHKDIRITIKLFLENGLKLWEE